MNETPASSSITAWTTALALMIRWRMDESYATFIAVTPALSAASRGWGGLHLGEIDTDDLDGGLRQVFPAALGVRVSRRDNWPKMIWLRPSFSTSADVQQVVEAPRFQVVDVDVAYDEDEVVVADQVALARRAGAAISVRQRSKRSRYFRMVTTAGIGFRIVDAHRDGKGVLVS